jgi:SOS-response transcriptional repressor LexA
MNDDPRTPAAVAAVLRKGANARSLWIDVAGRSMGSALGSGRVLVDPTAPLRRGRIWAFRSDDKIVVHRLLGRRGERVWLQGDANSFADPPVTIDRLIGEVTVIETPDGTRRPFGRVAAMRGRMLVDYRAVRGRVFSARSFLRRKFLSR